MSKRKVYTESEEQFSLRVKFFNLNYEGKIVRKFNGDLDHIEFYNTEFDDVLEELHYAGESKKVYRKFTMENAHAYKPFDKLKAIV